MLDRIKNHVKNEHKEIIRIRNGPAENHKGSPWLGESHGTKDNLKPRTNIFFWFPKKAIVIQQAVSCVGISSPYSCVESDANKKDLEVI